MFSVLGAVALTLTLSTSVFAYVTLNNHVIVNGISGQFYYVAATGYWVNPFNNAYTNWYNTSTPVNFSKTSNQSASIVDCYTYSSSTDGNNGFTRFYINSTQISPYSQNWYWCDINLNTYNLSSTATTYDDGVAGHEIGHTMGLDENNSNQYSIMCQAAYGRKVTTPQSDDGNGINYLY